MTENLQEKLHQGERKQLKGSKILQNFLQNIWKIKYAKSNPEDILKSAKNFLENLNTKEDSSKTTISKFLSKISNRKKTSKQYYNFRKAKTSLEVHGL